MRRKKKTKLLVFGIIVLMIGIMIGIIPIFIQKIKSNQEQNKMEDYLEITTSKNQQKTQKDSTDNYLMLIEIPKISLKRGIYSLESPQNSIEYNVTIMKESTMPDTQHGNVVLAAHSGPADISFFNDLYKLEKGDQAYIYYQGTKYTYTVDNQYDVKKDGTVEVSRDEEKETLTLITCKNNTNDRQSVTILYLSSKESY